MPIHVIVADRERTFADALAARLGAEDDIEVVRAIRLTAPGNLLAAAGLADVMLLDGDLPGQDANRLSKELSARAGAAATIMLSSSSEPERIVEAIRAGASAWVRKDESMDRLLCVIRGVARGETWLPASETGSVLRLLLRARDRRRESERLLAALTPRERAVLACLAEGAGHREIARELHLSVNTVRTHLQNLMAKLDVHSALEAVALTRDSADWPHNRLGVPEYVSPHSYEGACVRWGMCWNPRYRYGRHEGKSRFKRLHRPPESVAQILSWARCSAANAWKSGRCAAPRRDGETGRQGIRAFFALNKGRGTLPSWIPARTDRGTWREVTRPLPASPARLKPRPGRLWQVRQARMCPSRSDYRG